MIPESIVYMLSCARIGVIHNIIFGGFSVKEVVRRCLDCKPKIFLSASCGLEPHKTVDFPIYLR